ncbi:hypothetical protein LTR10_014896 [Elasticomyces elasticus]|uniref:Aconitate hydratase n=1 Tax=Exophiala sideris TaxID=1016849 RepID=A0ABR0JFP0_9EURO|nr:hypothetical protein LTR10_014896 [Elasticomyces elasticus]KAK5025740.1 hypothetical protein LTS07_007944 [Exophiala sideris]KAK5033052.1 hypothetical protein LTR13_007017 [Exophiala sideris]KAK5063537.1 hypothetical protein LTR69_004243 [Exophiala sideris]KAK5180631.1 hypothetical protein LTR44_006945 [Eurotiomycetes sp. CCFEE 6388]
MGATDVCMPLVTGQTWFSVPKTVNLRLINQPPPGVGGKDTILYILKEFKRNTIAADCVVEFTGPGLQHLSCDARFAIANMCTEFGAVTGIFEADERTMDFIGRRRTKKHKNDAVYFKADPDAEYAGRFEVDLSKVESFVAVHPSPDNVVPVSEVAGTRLDGTFIGACTTAEEDLVIGALVLKAGLERGQRPCDRGQRLVVPGSKPIRHKLEKIGLLDIYRRAGFRVGVPGCSMCVGQGVDQAAPGEVWLSSQNRNFPNRMGPSSLANLGSAATVAASSFLMTICDPKPLLEAIDAAYLQKCLGYQPSTMSDEPRSQRQSMPYLEPYGADGAEHCESQEQPGPEKKNPATERTGQQGSAADVINGRVLVLGDFIDTDAIIPSKFLAGNTTNESLGEHCMEFFMPDFRGMVRDGLNIVVGGKGFGCGSSRDVAVNALLGAGVKCVIAKSFAFIYARNQPNIGLLGIIIEEEEFHHLATQGKAISIDLSSCQVRCGGRSFCFQLSTMEKSLIAAGGLTEAFRRFGTQVFDALCQHKKLAPSPQQKGTDIESIGY